MAPATRSQTARATAQPDASTHSKHYSSLHDEPAPHELDNMTRPQSKAFSEIPPVYTIDLSLPPAQRYVQVAKDFKSILLGLTALFDELLEEANLPRRPLHWFTHIILRRLHSKEQTQELRGIQKVTGVPMYLLIAYNVLLDLFMGCTSGGIMVRERNGREKKMMHFRTLDWGMPELRKALVQFEFKQTKDGPVIARAINYVGFVGILTGVKQHLSVSLNFRPYHNDDASHWTNIKFYMHHVLVLLGFRPSIASHLRDFILPPHKLGSASYQTVADIAKDFPSVSTTATYLILCDGEQTLVLEKDRKTAKPLISTSFITATNHDVSYERSNDVQAAHVAHTKDKQFGMGMQEIVEESIDRKNCMVRKWEKRCKMLGSRLRVVNGNENEAKEKQPDENCYVRFDELKEWLLDYPITSDETHFATIMDPTKGSFAWVRRFEEPAVKDEINAMVGVDLGEMEESI